MEPGAIFAVIGYRIPGFLELTLPLAFFPGEFCSPSAGFICGERDELCSRPAASLKRRLLGYTRVLAVLLALL
jgi:lipopolysaccharide export system permease protein